MKKLYYYSPYIPFIGFWIVVFSKAGNNCIYEEDEFHNRLSLFVQLISYGILILKFL